MLECKLRLQVQAEPAFQRLPENLFMTTYR